MKNILLIVTLLLCVANLIADPNGMSMHRVQAGAPEADGWYSASSTDGAFSVRLPIPFNDFTAPANDDGKERCYVIGSKASNGVKFSAVRMPILKPRKSIRDFLVEFAQGLEKQGILSEKHLVEIEGRECLDCSVKNSYGGAFSRVVGLNDGALVMTVEYPAGVELDTVRQAAAKFFASANVLKQKPNQALVPMPTDVTPAAGQPVRQP